MKIILFSIVFLLFGCASFNASNIYHEIDSDGNGVSDTFKAQDKEFEIYGKSLISEENSVMVALYRAKELCSGNFSISEIESGFIFTTHCTNCGLRHYYKASIKCHA